MSTQQEQKLCWTCDEKPATHSVFRDALNENELTCDECYAKEYESEEDYDICGVTGGDIDDCCGQKVLAEDTMMIDNTSVCIGCYEKWCKVEKEEESFTDKYCEWLRLKDIDCGDDKTLREYKKELAGI